MSARIVYSDPSEKRWLLYVNGIKVWVDADDVLKSDTIYTAVMIVKACNQFKFGEDDDMLEGFGYEDQLAREED